MSGQEQDKATGNVEQPFDQLAANLDGDGDEPSQEQLQLIMEQEEKATAHAQSLWAGAVAFLKRS
ncbi:MAG: hypothetical protein R2854_08330 [Caldilineaceae bacterium]